MHSAVKRFLKEVRQELPHKFRLRKVVECGSHNINGSPRKYFWFCKYVGVDISKGKGVDVAGKFTEVELPYDSFGVVISVECLEHNSDWEETLVRMYNLLEHGGLMIVTCAAPDRPEHGTRRTMPECSPDTQDYYHNISIEEFEKALPRRLFKEYVLQYARGMNDLQFYGIKNPDFRITSKQIYKALLEKNADSTI